MSADYTEPYAALCTAELDRLVGERFLSNDIGWMKFYSSSGSGHVIQELQKRDWGLRFFWGASWQGLAGLWHVMIDRPDFIASHSATAKTFGEALCRAVLIALDGQEIPIGPSYRKVVRENGTATLEAAQ